MTAPATISVLIAAHNAAPWLEQAVTSAARQTKPPFEILVFDDASTDSTAASLAELERRLHCIRSLHSPTNIGPADARNSLLAQAKGDWIAVLDADDAWEPWHLEIMAPYMASHDIVSGNIANWNGSSSEGSIVPESFFGARQAVRIDPIRFAQWNLGLLKPLIRKAFLESNSLAWRAGEFHGEDLDFYLRCLLGGARWLQLPQAGYLYRRHGASLSRNWNEGLSQSRSLLERLRREIYPNEPKLASELAARIADKDHIRKVYEWREAVGQRSGILERSPAAILGALSLCVSRIRRELHP